MATEAPRYRKIESQAQFKEETDTSTVETDVDLNQSNIEKR
jgi:hypothetical protein